MEPKTDTSIKAASQWEVLTPGTATGKEYKALHVKTGGLFTVVGLDGSEMEFNAADASYHPLRFSYIKVGALAAGFVGLNT